MPSCATPRGFRWEEPSTSVVGETMENRTRPVVTSRPCGKAFTVATRITRDPVAVVLVEAWSEVTVGRFPATVSIWAEGDEVVGWVTPLSKTRPSKVSTDQFPIIRRWFVARACTPLDSYATSWPPRPNRNSSQNECRSENPQHFCASPISRQSSTGTHRELSHQAEVRLGRRGRIERRTTPSRYGQYHETATPGKIHRIGAKGIATIIGALECATDASITCFDSVPAPCVNFASSSRADFQPWRTITMRS